MKDINTRIRDCEIEIAKLSSSKKDIFELPEKVQNLENLQNLTKAELENILDGQEQQSDEISCLRTSQTEHEATLENLQNSLDNMGQSNTVLGEELEGLEENFSTLQTRIAGFENQISSANSQISNQGQALSGKINKVTNGVQGNFAGLSVDGNLVDSGCSPATINNLNSRINTQETLQNSQTLQIDALQEANLGLDNRVTAVEGLVSGQSPADLGDTNEDIARCWGQKRYFVDDMSSLRTNFVEKIFNNSSKCVLQLGTQGANGPTAKIFYRINPLMTDDYTVFLKFFMSPMPENMLELPCEILVNNQQVFTGNLQVLNGQNHTAEKLLNLNSATFDRQMFNQITVVFNAPALCDTYLDYVEVQISGATNSIVLNRSTDFEMYGLMRANNMVRMFTRVYEAGGHNYVRGGNVADVIGVPNISLPVNEIQGSKIRYWARYLTENFGTASNVRFVSVSDYYYEYIITQNNTFYFYYTFMPISNLGLMKIPNVMSVKKSLHNGESSEIDMICFVKTDFSVGMVYGWQYSTTWETNFFNNVSFGFREPNANTIKNYPAEFVDFIPVKDFAASVPSSRTARQKVGYFLLHQSGTILFVPELISQYFIEIGRGRQVNAFYARDELSISVFFELNNHVYKKILKRENRNSEWVLDPKTEVVFDTDEFYDAYLRTYVIKNKTLTRT